MPSVLIIVENLPVPFDRRVWMEATSLQKAGWEVAVICPLGKGYERRYEVIEGVHIYRHPLPLEADSLLGYAREYFSAIWHESRLSLKIWRRHRFEVVHLCNPPDLLFLAAAPYKLLQQARVIFDQHDIMPELFEAKFRRRGLGYLAVRAAERCTYALADVVIATNRSYREIAIRRGRKRPEDVFIVRSAPDLSQFHQVEANSRHKQGRDYLVGYVGVMGPQEGIDHLLRAVNLIVHQEGRRDIGFCLIGDGPSRQSLQAMAHDLGVDEFVQFPGRLPDGQLIELLSSVDLCVNPDPKNPFNDASTMNKILEYMALGRPVVQFDLTEGRRSAGEASVYALPNDDADLARKIVQVVDDPHLRDRMSREGLRRMAEELEWRHQVPRLLEAYGRCVRKDADGVMKCPQQSVGQG